MNNRSAFRRLLANRKYRQSILRNLLRGIFSNRLIEALIPKWNRFDGLLSITKRGAATIRKRAIEMNPFAELTTGHGSVRIVPQRLRFENLEERRVLAFSSIIVDGTAGNDSLVIIATGIDSGSYSLNGGVAVPFASLSGWIYFCAKTVRFALVSTGARIRSVPRVGRAEI